MTEVEWLTYEDPIDMLLVTPGRNIGDRKARLFLVACCRRIWDVMSAENRIVVEAAERAADGQLTDGELAGWASRSRLYRDVDDEDTLPEDQPPSYWCDVAAWKAAERRPVFESGDVCDATRRVAGDRSGEWEDAAQARLLRCVAGNPFRPVGFAPGWRTETAVALATGIYADRSFDRLPVLADALEEAGCDHPDVLAHCRDPGPHARGCWVVDAVLGKE